MEEEAMGVLERLVGEDDGSVEAWYLGGWCLWLLGEKEEESRDESAADGNGGEGEDTASLVASREWLRQSLALYEKLEYEDERLRDHAVELVGVLDERLKGCEMDGDDDGGDAEGEEEAGDEDEDEDEEMQGT